MLSENFTALNTNIRKEEESKINKLSIQAKNKKGQQGVKQKQKEGGIRDKGINSLNKKQKYSKNQQNPTFIPLSKLPKWTNIWQMHQDKKKDTQK